MRAKTIYGRPRIDKLLSSVKEYPVLVLTAGAGYGKTTAAREYLKKAGVPYAWVGLCDGDPMVFWEKLCLAIEPFSKSAADTLHTLGMPCNDWEINQVSTLARKLKRDYIVCIDDYQLLPMGSPIHHLLDVLIFEEIEHLHLMLLSRSQPNIRFASFVSKDMCMYMDGRTLAFNRRETGGYLAMRGLRLADSVSDAIQEDSDGWISAIYLMSEGIRNTGSMQNLHGIDGLFEENLIARLEESDQMLLFRLSAFDSFPMAMAETALGSRRICEIIESMVKSNAFISMDDSGAYHFHPLLHSFLQSHCPNDETQRNVLRRGGLWYLSRKDYQYRFTVRLFEEAKCADVLLDTLNHPFAQGLCYYDLEAICTMVMSLPTENCIQYPFPYLRMIFFMLLSEKTEHNQFAKYLFNLMKEHFQPGRSSDEDRICAELLVIDVVTGSCGEKGRGMLETAAKLFQGVSSQIVQSSHPFTFGLPMLLYSVHIEPGTMDAAVNRWENNPYELVTDGFGRGSGRLLHAEAALLRLELDEAAINANSAIVLAKEKQQRSIIACANFVLMRKALYQGDIEGALSAMQRIQALLSESLRTKDAQHVEIITLRELNSLCLCFLNTALGQWQKIPEDFLDGTHKTFMMNGFGVPQIYAAKASLVVGNVLEAECLCQRIVGVKRVGACSKITGMLIHALAREQLYGTGSGEERMTEALLMAQKDQIVLPFAESPSSLPLLYRIKKQGTVEENYLAKVIAATEGYKEIGTGWIQVPCQTLSQREMEVLRLCAQGKTNKGIAGTLVVQEDTVKKHLQNIYRKLGASNKMDAIRIARTSHIL